MRTSELTGVMLNYWVAKAEGICLHDAPHTKECGNWGTDYTCTRCKKDASSRPNVGSWHPSTDWAQGGPLIEKYRIGFGIYEPGERGYFACTGVNDSHGVGTGPDHLIAACRAVVQAVFGDEVQEGSESNG